MNQTVKGKLNLPNVTLAAMTSVNVYETIRAMEYSMRGITFGDVVLITHRKPLFLPKDIRYSHTSKLDDIDKFNYKMVYEIRETHQDGVCADCPCGRLCGASRELAGCVSGL